MKLKEFVKSFLAKVVPEIKVHYGSLQISGSFEDRGFLRALAKNQREPFMVATMLERIQPGSIFLDIGGHLGQYSLLVAEKIRAHGAGQVHVFEPHPRSYKYLLKNLKSNSLEDFVSLHNWCASDEKGSVTLFVDNLQSDFTSTVPGAEGSSSRTAIEVESIVLDEYFANREVPSLVKIDVEGAELMVLNGMKGLIEHRRPTLFIESNAEALRRSGSSPEVLYNWLSSHYSVICVIDEVLEELRLIKDSSVIVDKCVNLICEN